MLKLSLPKEPYWINVGLDVRLKVHPCTSAVFYQARAFMNQKLQKLDDTYRAEKDIGVEHLELSDLEGSNVREALAEQYLTIGLARTGVIEWEGILEADADSPVPVTEQKIEKLFGTYWVIAETFRQQCTGMRARIRWHSGDGPRYCGNCAEQGRVCAQGQKGETGERCPYREHSLKTLEGWQAWDVACKLITQTHERFSLETTMQLSASLDNEPQAMAELLPEVAMRALLAMKDMGDNHDNN